MKTFALFILTASALDAAPIQVRSGSVVVDFDPAALADLNAGSNPNIDALILEEFFREDADRLRTRNQIVADQIVPGFTAIPTQGLKFMVNGDTVTNINPVGQPVRNRKPSTFSYDPANPTGTATGEIGLTGCIRFIGDFTGVFVLGDLVLRYNLPANQTEPNRGWVFVNHFDFPGTPVFETANVLTTAANGTLTIEGDITISREFDLFFLPGDRGTPIGTFRMQSPTPATTPPALTLARQNNGAVILSFLATGNAIFKVQYSPDLHTWETVPGWQVTGRNQIVTWTDSGPPATPSVPGSETHRFYRLTVD